jgi:translation elongation factor EF-G
MENELELLKQLYRRTLPEEELIDIFYQNRDRYRVLLQLLQQFRFPEKLALNIIPKLYPMDLIKVVKNKLTNAAIRKRAELEFVNKYNKYPLGEKISYIKIAPNSLLNYFIEENDKSILEALLKNAYCTEEVLLKFVNRKTDKTSFYEALCATEWYKRPQVAFAISHDSQAPIRILVTIIPYLSLKQLENLYKSDKTHQIVKKNILQYLQDRESHND